MQVTLDKNQPTELISANERAQASLRFQNTSTRTCYVWLGTEDPTPPTVTVDMSKASRFTLSRGPDCELGPGESIEVKGEDFAWAYTGERTLFCVTGVFA